VADCGAWLHSAHRKSDMIMKDYLQYWQDISTDTPRILPPATPISSGSQVDQSVSGCGRGWSEGLRGVAHLFK